MSAALSNIMKTAHFGVWDQMGHKLCHLFSKKHTKCEYCQHQYILLILLKRKILICMPFFSSDPASSDQCFAMSLTIIHSAPKSASQAKLKFACICQSCSLCLSWLLIVFLEMLHKCQTKPSWISTTTKLLLSNWNDFASCLGLVWTSILCAAIHNHSQKLLVLVKILVRLSDDGTEFEQSLHLIQFSTPGSVVPMDHLWNETTFNVY